MKNQIRSNDSTLEICLQHFYDSLTCFSVLSDVKMTSSDEMTQIISPGIPNWLTNAVFKIRIQPDNITQQINRITQIYQQQQVIPFWRLCLHDSPTNLDHHLRIAGYEQKTQHFLMSIQLNTIKFAPSVPNNILIRQITSASDLRENHPSFQGIKKNHKSFATLMRDLFDFYDYEQDSSWKHYVAVHDGQSIGYASVFYTGEVLGIYNLGVLSNARRRGLGTALTIRALRDAQEHGYLIGTLQSSQMAHHMYQKIGFQTHLPITYFAPV